MKRYITVIWSALLIVALSSCSEEQKIENEAQKPAGIAVQTKLLKPDSFYEYLEVTGTVIARNQISLVAEEGGLLKDIRKDKGRESRKGDTLAVLENKVLKAAYNEAAASLGQARLDFKSSKVLFQKKAISENDYLASQYNLDRATAAYDLAQARYSKLFLTAPITSHVNDRYYDFGAYIMPMTPVFELIDDEYVKISAGIAERFIADIHMGTPVTMTFDAFPGLSIDCQVSFIAKSIDQSSRTFKVEIEIKNPEKKLAPQMIANVRMLRKVFENEIVIPIDAMMTSEDGRYVFIKNRDKAKKVKVDILAIEEDSVLVRGLHVDEQLIVLGQQNLSDGEEIYTVDGVTKNTVQVN